MGGWNTELNSQANLHPNLRQKANGNVDVVEQRMSPLRSSALNARFGSLNKMVKAKEAIVKSKKPLMWQANGNVDVVEQRMSPLRLSALNARFGSLNQMVKAKEALFLNRQNPWQNLTKR